MTADQYRQALTTLNLTQGQVAKWLGVSLKTSHLYARNGPSGPAARAVGMAVALRNIERIEVLPLDAYRTGGTEPCADGEYVRHDDLTAAIGLDKIRPEPK